MLQPISLLCIFMSVMMMFGTSSEGYQLLFLEPLFFGILYYYSKALRRFKFQYVALAILFVTSFIKYVITPFVLFSAGYPSTIITLGGDFLTQSILMQCYEEIFFFGIINYASNHFYISDKSLPYQAFYVPPKNKILYIVILIAIGLALYSPSLLSRFHFVWTLKGNEEFDINENEGLGGLGLLINVGRFFIILLLLLNLYKVRKNKQSILLSLIVILINATIVHDFSRFGIIIPATTFIYLLTLLYPDKKKKIIGFALISIGASVVFTSIVKMFSEYRGGAERANEILYWAESLQLYFQGTNEVAIGLHAAEKHIIHPLLTLCNDAIANVALLSKLSIQELNSLYIFNTYRSGGISYDKILPNICAGFNYFGVIGSPVIICVCSFFAIRFDALSLKMRNLHSKFIAVYAAITLSLCHMIYYTMIISTLINTILVMYILLKLNRKLN